MYRMLQLIHTQQSSAGNKQCVMLTTNNITVLAWKFDRDMWFILILPVQFAAYQCSTSSPYIELSGVSHWMLLWCLCYIHHHPPRYKLYDSHQQTMQCIVVHGTDRAVEVAMQDGILVALIAFAVTYEIRTQNTTTSLINTLPLCHAR